MSILTTRRQWLIRAAQLSAMSTLQRGAWSQNAKLQHAPFSLGIASGDPSPDGFVLWTRLMPDAAPPAGTALPPQVLSTLGTQTLRWEVANDERFRQIVARGVAEADPLFAHSVHVEVRGLSPGRWYFYRFMHGDAVSATGRTRTAPAAHELPERLRVIYASCQRWEHGFYSAWRHAAAQSPDLVLFLGDYMYEYASPARPEGMARVHHLHLPRTLADFRDRYALHKSDPDLQLAHTVAPWIVTWDDHEVQNDYTASQGKAGMTPDFLLMRTAAWQAFYEHMPLRASTLAANDGFHSLQLHRRFQWGRLANIHLLDARQYRDRQACRKMDGAAKAQHPDQCAELADPARSFLGLDQERWLEQGLLADAHGSKPHWSVIAQQTLFSPRTYPSGTQSTDSWDGYPPARDRLIRAIDANPPRNTVFLGGDIHQNYVCNVEALNAREGNGKKPRVIASEFCGTSITSRSGTTQDKVDAIRQHNPHVLFARSEERGYGLCDITPDRWTTTLNAVANPLNADSGVLELAKFVVEDRRPGIQLA
ncbi:alkaline phosphatase D family protein [Diaphorobacter caeni]|uniref:alkaline phosphatase D family protein n=1 Tax=Diaphorobacter caeni TaxID=2784387 RepID=UPI00188F326A|nr:alkaline phosphatase D family protein [Diaphorobacter caeni]MBF5007164.1 alkaline phosphatase D family protein [Diaphorobacter caeni]